MGFDSKPGGFLSACSIYDHVFEDFLPDWRVSGCPGDERSSQNGCMYLQHEDTDDDDDDDNISDDDCDAKADITTLNSLSGGEHER